MNRKRPAIPGVTAPVTMPIATPAGVEVGEVRWDASAALVAVGDVHIPERVEAVFYGGERQPQLTLTLEVRDSVPGFTRIELLSSDRGPLVIAKHLTLARDRLGLWRDMIIKAVAQQSDDSDDSAWSTPSWADPAMTRASIRRARPMQREITPEKLATVAGVYAVNIAGKPVEAVADHFGVPHRTAARWVQMCRSDEYGLLPKTTRGQRKA
jgi:hypothetical protein